MDKVDDKQADLPFLVTDAKPSKDDVSDVSDAPHAPDAPKVDSEPKADPSPAPTSPAKPDPNKPSTTQPVVTNPPGKDDPQPEPIKPKDPAPTPEVPNPSDPNAPAPVAKPEGSKFQQALEHMFVAVVETLEKLALSLKDNGGKLQEVAQQAHHWLQSFAGKVKADFENP